MTRCPGRDAAADDTADDRHDDDDAAGVAAAVPGRRPRRRHGARRDHVLARPRSDDRAGADRADRPSTTPARTRCGSRLENQGGYKQTIDKYVQSSQDEPAGHGDVPGVHGPADRRLRHVVIPVGACIEASGFDTSAFLPRALLALPDRTACSGRCRSTSATPSSTTTGGVRGGRPRPGRPAGVARGAAGDVAGDRRHRRRGHGHRPRLRRRLRRRLVPRAVVRPRRRAATPTTATAGWRRRRGSSTTAPLGVDLMTDVQSLIDDGLAVTVGDNPSGQDALLKLADPDSPAAMAIATSAALGTVLSVLDGGLIPGHHERPDVGVGPMPGPGDDAVGDRRRGVAVHRRRQGRRPGGRGVGLHPVPRRAPRRSRRGRRRPGTCRSARTPSSSIRCATTYATDPAVQGRLRPARRRRRRPRRRSDRCSARCARCARSPPAPWRRSSAAPTSPPRSPPPPAQSDALIADYNARN